jgi:hypothetical protein
MPLPEHATPPIMPLPLRLTLIQRDDCPLCDQAWEVLAAAGVPDFDPLWIDDDLGLQAQYGERVPVLRAESTGRELDWPFDVVAVRRLLADKPA